MSQRLMTLVLLLGACSTVGAEKRIGRDGGVEPVAFRAGKKASASKAFLHAWSDGKAELSAYQLSTPRYGQARKAELVLIYVTEPLNRTTLIKDDHATGDARFGVLKLNAVLKFQTGIYPYSVMTSVFSPVDNYGGERFAPLKIALSAQEWCGHVYHQLRPAQRSFYSVLHSYFASEGDRTERVPLPEGTLYEDGLLIQLRELDGPFNHGKNWRGSLVPSLWTARKAHRALRPAAATIERQTLDVDGSRRTRFTLRYASSQRTIDVEDEAPRRILGWSSSDGETATLRKTKRLPYWSLHEPGDERYRAELGLP